MRLPRDVSGEEFARALHVLGLPKHDSLRVGTVAGIMAEVARHLGIEREELVRLLFDR